MISVTLEDDVGVVKVECREAARLERYFDSLIEHVKHLNDRCERVFVCFPSVAAAKRFRGLYRERIGPINEHDFENDNEVILKFSL